VWPDEAQSLPVPLWHVIAVTTSDGPPTSRTPVLLKLVALLVVAGAALFVRQVLYEPVWVPSNSMEPAVQKGDHLLVSLRAYAHHPPRRGDIVLFRWPDDPGEKMLKRIIGLPGETVFMVNGRVFINGRPLAETYLKEPPVREHPYAALLGPDEFWVLGDNRNHSEDSRDHGPLPRAYIAGQAVYRYLPWRHHGPLR